MHSCNAFGMMMKHWVLFLKHSQMH